VSAAEVSIDEMNPFVGHQALLSGTAPPHEDVWVVVQPQAHPYCCVQPKARADDAGRWATTANFGMSNAPFQQNYYITGEFVGTGRDYAVDERLDRWPTARHSSLVRIFKRDR
jgi:hypothetical protein